MPDSPHGFAVTFGGVALGKLRRFRVTLPGGQVLDVTGQGATILGTGVNSRVVRQIDVTAVDPVTLEVEFIGTNGLGPNDRGRRATLVATGAGFTVSGAALLTNVDLSGEVRDKVRGVATFQLVGV